MPDLFSPFTPPTRECIEYVHWCLAYEDQCSFHNHSRTSNEQSQTKSKPAQPNDVWQDSFFFNEGVNNTSNEEQERIPKKDTKTDSQLSCSWGKPPTPPEFSGTEATTQSLQAVAAVLIEILHGLPEPLFDRSTEHVWYL